MVVIANGVPLETARFPVAMEQSHAIVNVIVHLLRIRGRHVSNKNLVLRQKHCIAICNLAPVSLVYDISLHKNGKELVH